MPRFLFATGIEGSYPVISDGHGGTLRQDQMEASDHYRRWREDFDLVAGLGRRAPPLGAADPPDLDSGPGGTTGRSATRRSRDLGRTGDRADRRPLPLRHARLAGQQLPEPRIPPEFAALRRRLRPALPPRPPLHAGQRDLHLRPLQRRAGLVERAADEPGASRRRRPERPAGGRRLGGGPGGRGPVRHGPEAPLPRQHPGDGGDPRGDPAAPCSSRARAPSIYHPISPAVEARADFLNLRRFLSLDLTYGRHVSAPIYQYLNDNGLGRARVRLVHGARPAAPRPLHPRDRLLPDERAAGPPRRPDPPRRRGLRLLRRDEGLRAAATTCP